MKPVPAPRRMEVRTACGVERLPRCPPPAMVKSHDRPPPTAPPRMIQRACRGLSSVAISIECKRDRRGGRAEGGGGERGARNVTGAPLTLQSTTMQRDLRKVFREVFELPESE